MKNNLSTCFYIGNVMHKRFQPFVNQFTYKVFSLLLDYNEIKILSKKSLFFSYNKFNLFSFYDLDHGYRNKYNIKKFVFKELKKNNILYKKLNIKILCFPRILGYVFNPLSIIYCYDKDKLISIFYEVKNTYNEQHTYIFINKKNIKKNLYIHRCNKKFFVSPFLKIDGYYKFYVRNPKNSLSVIIKQFLPNNSKILIATQNGKRAEFNSFNILRLFIFYPLLTFKIIYSIHWQAIKIWLKGGRYYSRKPKIVDTKSYEGDLVGKI